MGSRGARSWTTQWLTKRVQSLVGEFGGSPCEIVGSPGNITEAVDVHTLHQWYQQKHQLYCEVVCWWLPHIQAHPVSAGCNSPVGGPRPAVQLDASKADAIQPRQSSVHTITRRKHPVISTYRMLGSLKHYDHHPHLGVEIAKDLDSGQHRDTITKAHRSLKPTGISAFSGETKEKAYTTLVGRSLNTQGWSGSHTR